MTLISAPRREPRRGVAARLVVPVWTPTAAVSLKGVLARRAMPRLAGVVVLADMVKKLASFPPPAPVFWSNVAAGGEAVWRWALMLPGVDWRTWFWDRREEDCGVENMADGPLRSCSRMWLRWKKGDGRLSSFGITLPPLFSYDSFVSLR